MENKAKSLTELQENCAQITQEVLSLASLGEIMIAKMVCEKVIRYGWEMYQQGCDTALGIVDKDRTTSIEGESVTNSQEKGDKIEGDKQ